MDAFGSGLVWPFLIVYLHAIVGLGYATAGTVLSAAAVTAIIVGPAVGGIIDSSGPRRLIVASLVAQAIAYGAFGLVRATWQAYAVGLAMGLASSAFWPAQRSLLASLVPSRDRPVAFAASDAARSAGLGLGAVLGGLVVSHGTRKSFELLFGLDAFSCFVALALPCARGVACPASRLPSGVGPQGAYSMRCGIARCW